MAYNRKNILLRMIDIQDIYMANSRRQRGNMLDCDIYDKLVAPTYHISRKTFYDYLGTNAKKELADLLAAKEKQLTLFE